MIDGLIFEFNGLWGGVTNQKDNKMVCHDKAYKMPNELMNLAVVYK